MLNSEKSKNTANQPIMIPVSCLDRIPEERRSEVADFAKGLGENAAEEYFHAIADTGKVDILTSKEVLRPEVMEFVRGLCAAEAYAYFRAIHDTGKTDILTSKEVMDFASGLGKYAAVGYFWGVDYTREVDILTSKEVLRPEVMDFASGLGGDAARGYFWVIGRTGKVDILTSKEFIDFAKGLGEDAAKEYFHAIANTGKGEVDILTSKEVMDFARGLGEDAAGRYFNVIGYTFNKVDILTSKEVLRPEVMEFVRGLGEAAEEYFRAIANTGKVDILTSKEVLRPEVMEFARGLGKAADDYFSALCTLAEYGYEAGEEFQHLAKGWSRAHSLAFCGNLLSLKSDWVEHKAKETFRNALSFIKEAKEKEYTNVAQRVELIDLLVLYAGLSKRIPAEIREKLQKKIEVVLNPPSEALSEEEIRGRCPDAYAYLARHSGIDREEAMRLLSTCIRFLGREPNFSSVNTEKQMLSRGREVKIKKKYEENFMKELRHAAGFARCNALKSAVNVHHKILETIIGQELEKRELSDDMKSVLAGYFRLEYNKEIATKLIKTYHIEGREAAVKMLSSMPENVRLIREMRGRGTDIEAVNAFEVTYTDAETTTTEDAAKRESLQVYGEIKRLLGLLGTSMQELGVSEGDNMIENAEDVSKALNEKVAGGGFLPSEDQMLIIKDIKEQVNALKGGIGQLSARDRKAKFYVSTDPMETMCLGVGFLSCHDIEKGSFSYAAVTKTVDANNVTIYAENGGRRVGRVSLIECDKGFLVCSQFYQNTNLNLMPLWNKALEKFAKESGRAVIIPAGYIKTDSPAGTANRTVTRLHISKGVCDYIYADIIEPQFVGEAGVDLAIDAVVLSPDAADGAASEIYSFLRRTESAMT